MIQKRAGPENAQRLLKEFPEIEPLINGCYGKKQFPIQLVNFPYCIDDEAIDEEVLKCNYVIIDTYDGGEDSGLLLEAAKVVVEHIKNIS